MKNHSILNQFIIICLFASIILCEEPLSQNNQDIKSKQSLQIYPLKQIELGEITSTWNKTYVFSGNMIKNNQIIIELEIETPISVHNSIVFGLKKDRALYYSNQTDTFNALYIDSRAYYMRKQYYRIDYQFNEHFSESDQFYVTIYQNTLNPQFLKYSMKFLSISLQSLSQNVCPFNCLNRGSCDEQQRHCVCSNGYVDYDCSKPSTSLQMQNELSGSSKETLSEILEFDSTSLRNGKFYHIYENQFDGYLYIQISLSEEQKEKLKNQNNEEKYLEIYYTLEKKGIDGLGVADRKFAQLSKKYQIEDFLNSDDAIEMYIDEFHPEQNKIINELGNKDEQKLLFGFRLNESGLANNFDSIQFHIKFVIKNSINLASSYLNFFDFFNDNQIVGILLILLLILISILFSLIIFIKRNSSIIQQTQQQYQQSQLEKKLKKEEEFQKMFDLIYHFKFTEVTKQRHWPQLFNQSQLIQNTNSEQPSCSICYCDFELEEEVRLTYCSHFFHSECLKQWLKKQKNCPNCRNDLNEPSLQEKKKSPSTFLRQIFRNRLGSAEKKHKQGYSQQIDEIGLNIQPIKSELTNQVEKTDNNTNNNCDNKCMQIINLNQISNVKFKSSESFYKKDQQQQRKRLLSKMNSIKHNSVTEIDEIQSKEHIDDSISMQSKKYLKQGSIESPLPAVLSKFNQMLQKSKMQQQN